MRYGSERLGGMVRERMGAAEPRSRALFVFVSKRDHTMKVLTWDGTGVIVIHKRLDAGKFELPQADTGRRSARGGEGRGLRVASERWLRCRVRSGSTARAVRSFPRSEARRRPAAPAVPVASADVL